MARVKLRCIVGCPGLKCSYQEKGLFLIIFTRIKNTSNKIEILHSKKLVFRLCQAFSTDLGILECISKLLWIVFEIFTMHFWKIWTLYNTFTVPEAHKYELNKARTTDKDHEHMNLSRRSKIPKCPKFFKSLKIHSLGLYLYSCIVKDFLMLDYDTFTQPIQSRSSYADLISF